MFFLGIFLLQMNIHSPLRIHLNLQTWCFTDFFLLHNQQVKVFTVKYLSIHIYSCQIVNNDFDDDPLIFPLALEQLSPGCDVTYW